MGLGEGAGDGGGDGGGDGTGDGSGDRRGHRGGRHRARRAHRHRRNRHIGFGHRRRRMRRGHGGGVGGAVIRLTCCCGASSVNQDPSHEDIEQLRLYQTQMLMFVQQRNMALNQQNGVVIAQAPGTSAQWSDAQALGATGFAQPQGPNGFVQPQGGSGFAQPQGAAGFSQPPPSYEEAQAAFAAAMKGMTGEDRSEQEVVEDLQEQQMELLEEIMEKQAKEKDPVKLQELFRQQKDVIDQMNELQQSGYKYKTDIPPPPSYESVCGGPPPQVVYAHNVT